MNFSIPTKFKTLFWDCDFSQICIDSHKQFVIARLLEKGNKYAIKWVYDTFSLSDIKSVVYNSNNISSQTKNFWNIVLNYEA